jgi:hypothetical protein
MSMTNTLLGSQLTRVRGAAALDKDKKKDHGGGDVKPIAIGAGIGFGVGGILGALLWRKHRFGGFLVGGLLVGAPAGGVVGYLARGK